MWKGGGARVGGISEYLYLNFRGQKIENLVIRSLQAFNVQSFIIFTFHFIFNADIMHTAFSTNIQCPGYKSIFLKIEHIQFNTAK